MKKTLALGISSLLLFSGAAGLGVGEILAPTNSAYAATDAQNKTNSLNAAKKASDQLAKGKTTIKAPSWNGKTNYVTFSTVYPGTVSKLLKTYGAYRVEASWSAGNKYRINNGSWKNMVPYPIAGCTTVKPGQKISVKRNSCKVTVNVVKLNQPNNPYSGGTVIWKKTVKVPASNVASWKYPTKTSGKKNTKTLYVY